MNVRDLLRSYLFETLMPTAKDEWPEDDADLFEAGMDSLRVMPLLVFIEEKIGVLLPDHEVTPERIGSIAALTEWIEASRAS